MSLTSHLKNPRSPVRAFLETAFPDAKAVIQDCKGQLVNAQTIRPSETLEPATYRLLGTAMDYRLRYYFEPTKSRTLGAYKGGMLSCGRVVETPVGLHFNAPENPAICRWVDLIPETCLPEELVESFSSDIDVMIDRLKPAKRRLPEKDERSLARYCVALALFEQIFRGGVKINTPLLRPKPTETICELLDLAQDVWVDDMCSLSWAFHDKFAGLFQLETKLNPEFDGSVEIGEADADFIAGGCLIDIKTLQQPRLQPRLLYQLLGYALLDYTDTYKIREAGFYLARQQILLKWPLDELISRMSGGEALPIARMRKRFQKVVKASADTEGDNSRQPRPSFAEWVQECRKKGKLKTWW